jgi:hypothetical protein
MDGGREIKLKSCGGGDGSDGKGINAASPARRSQRNHKNVLFPLVDGASGRQALCLNFSLLLSLPFHYIKLKDKERERAKKRANKEGQL